MTRRQVLTLITVPSFIATLGVAAFELSEATGRGNGCPTGSGCCGPASCAAVTAEPAATAADATSGPCCAPSCCTTADAAESR